MPCDTKDARPTRVRAKIPLRLGTALLSAVCSLGAATAHPLGTAFSYQGLLTESGQPEDGLYDLQVRLFDTVSNPVRIAGAPDFGGSSFVGRQRFLAVRLRPGASSDGNSLLAPRQPQRAAPEALRATFACAAPWSGPTGMPPGFADGIAHDGGGASTRITAGTGSRGEVITDIES